jgi:hypothetical protein
MLVHLLTPLDITTSRLLGAVTVTYQTCSESRSITTAIFAFIDAVAPMTGFWVALAASFDGAFGLDAGTLRAIWPPNFKFRGEVALLPEKLSSAVEKIQHQRIRCCSNKTKCADFSVKHKLR